MSRRFLVLFIILLIIYLAISGGISPIDLLLGSITSIIVSALLSRYVIKSEEKLSVSRLVFLIKYFFHYLFVIEVKAHLNVMKRILSPSLPINPGIVEVPYDLESDYSATLTANSITNTPGTVVVSIDHENKKLYVHWIDVKTIDPIECRKYISETFEKYAKKIFD